MVRRLTTAKEVIEMWPFFQEGMEVLRKRSRYEPTDITIFKTLITLLELGDRAWIGVVESKNGKPLAFAAAYDNTPIFHDVRSFIVYVEYTNSKDPQALHQLMEAFEGFAKKEGVKHLYASTRRSNGAAIRCFKKYGLYQDYLFFKKEIQ